MGYKYKDSLESYNSSFRCYKWYLRLCYTKYNTDSLLFINSAGVKTYGDASHGDKLFRIIWNHQEYIENIFANNCVTKEPLFKTTNAHYTFTIHIQLMHISMRALVFHTKPNTKLTRELSQKQNYEALTTSHGSLSWSAKMAGLLGSCFWAQLIRYAINITSTTSKLLSPLSRLQSIKSILTNYQLYSPAPHPAPAQPPRDSSTSQYYLFLPNWNVTTTAAGAGTDIISSTQLC